MNDYEAIRRLLALYGQLLDSKRLDDWVGLFVEDAVFRVWGNVYRGRAEILSEIGGMQPDSPGKHVVIQPVIDLVDADHALAWTDLCALATTPPALSAESKSSVFSPYTIQIATIGRYHDRLVRSADEARWRIAERVLVMGGEEVPADVEPTPAL